MLLKERLFIGAGLLIVVGGSIVYFATKPAPTRFKRSAPEPTTPLVLPTLQPFVSDGDGKVDWKSNIKTTDGCFWVQLLSSSNGSNDSNEERKKVCSSNNRKNNSQNSSKEKTITIKK